MHKVKARLPATPRKSAKLAVPSRALAKGLEILDLIGSANQPLGLGAIAEASHLGKPSTLRLLQTLNSLAYVEKDADGNYVPGSRIPGVSKDDWVQNLVTIAASEMASLNADLAETVSLAVLLEDHIRVVHTVESTQHIRMSNYPNRILPPYASSLGKAITAYQEAEIAQTLIQVFGIYKITDKTLTEPVLIREDLSRTRERGYAVESEETVAGGCCFGAPIAEGDGLVRSAVSVSIPFARITQRTQKILPKLVIQTAEKISKLLR